MTTQNLEVVASDVERGVLMMSGAVPGSEGGWVLVKDAVKRKAPEGLPFPAACGATAAAAPTGRGGPTSRRPEGSEGPTA